MRIQQKWKSRRKWDKKRAIEGDREKENELITLIPGWVILEVPSLHFLVVFFIFVRSQYNPLRGPSSFKNSLWVREYTMPLVLLLSVVNFLPGLKPLNSSAQFLLHDGSLVLRENYFWTACRGHVNHCWGRGSNSAPSLREHRALWGAAAMWPPLWASLGSLAVTDSNVQEPLA